MLDEVLLTYIVNFGFMGGWFVVMYKISNFICERKEKKLVQRLVKNFDYYNEKRKTYKNYGE